MRNEEFGVRSFGEWDFFCNFALAFLKAIETIGNYRNYRDYRKL